jgi:predicted AAA+ superfamily ATPase
MVTRKYWINRINEAWNEKSLIFLSGVRRSGKTLLCQSLLDVEYFDCERPRVRQQMEDPDEFLSKLNGKRIVLDEIHRLDNPSELLKIAADHYSTVKIIATGSSTLMATAKFRDTLTGRKRDIHFTPMILKESSDFGNIDLSFRMMRGGLPPMFLSDKYPEIDFQEWIEAYWSKDIQALFRLGNRDSFLKFVELLFIQSGGMFEASKFAQQSGVSAPTIANYLRVLEATWMAQRIKPFSEGKRTEIVAAPKVFGFDTGFVSFFKGWETLRKEDMGILWEHILLNELSAHLPHQEIMYWRDKRGHEIDFIIKKRGQAPIAIECKLSAEYFEPRNLYIFRNQYSEGRNFVVSNNIESDYSKRYKNIIVEFVSINSLIDKLLNNFDYNNTVS